VGRASELVGRASELVGRASELVGRASELVGRASLDLATLGLKVRSWLSPQVLVCRRQFYFASSSAVSRIGLGMGCDALSRKWTELLGQLLGRNWPTARGS
jgi:hypothetical protein